MTMKPAFAEIDLSQLGFWERPLDERLAAFEVLRGREQYPLNADERCPENSERHVNG